jgi:hypothetical protein
MPGRGYNKMQEWRRRTPQSESYEPLKPFMHRCNRCMARDVSGIVCPDCLLRRSLVFLDVYGVTPDTRPYSIPRRLPEAPRSASVGVKLAGYPDSNRYGRRPL